MNNSINLLDYKNKATPVKNEKKQKRLRLISLSILFIASATSIIFFILVTLSPIPELRRQHKIASLNLSKTSLEIVKLSLTKERANNIKEIIDARPNYENVLENLQNKIPKGVAIRSVSIYKKDVTITFSSSSLLLLDNVLNDLMRADSSKSEFANIRLISLAAERSRNTFLLIISLNTI